VIPSNQSTPQPQSQPASAWVWAFRYLRWSTYLAALITLMLILHKATPPAVQVSPQAAARAEQKVSEVEQSVSRGEPATLRLDEAELNSYLASHLSSAPGVAVPQASPANSDPGSSSNPAQFPSGADVEQMRSNVKDVKVQLEGDRVKAYVVFDVHGKDLTLQLVGKIGASDGYLRFEPVSGQIGSLPIPQSALESAVRQLMESPENREKLKLPPDISDMHIEDGELVTTYHGEAAN
jgi:hypothetical protein